MGELSDYNELSELCTGFMFCSLVCLGCHPSIHPHSVKAVKSRQKARLPRLILIPLYIGHLYFVICLAISWMNKLCGRSGRRELIIVL